MSIFQDSSLTQGQRLVWFAVRELATDGHAPDNCSQIAHHMDSGRSHISRALSALREAGWIDRDNGLIIVNEEAKDREPNTQNRAQEAQDRDCEARDSEARKGFPLSSLPFSPKKVYSTPFEPALLSPSQSRLKPPSASSPRWLRPSDRFDSIKEPIPEDHPARWDHLPGDWTFDYASAALEHFREFNLLATPTKNKIDRDGEDYVISQWADTFRLLNEQDGYPKDEILATMKWLFSGNNFWIDKQAIRSVPPLRSKTSSGDAYKFDMMHQNAHEPTQTSSTGPGLRMPQEEKEMTLEDVLSN